MSEYKVIFRDDSPSYQLGCPLQINVIQIARNVETSQCFLQIKTTNISNSTIHAFSLQARVVARGGLTESVFFEHLDAEITAGAEFKPTPKPINAKEIDGALVLVTRVNNSGASAWQEPRVLAPQQAIELSERARTERRKQMLASGVNIAALPNIELKYEHSQGTERCTCGACNVNRKYCRICNAPFDKLELGENETALLEASDKRIVQQAEKAINGKNLSAIRSVCSSLDKLSDKEMMQQLEEACSKRTTSLKRRKKATIVAACISCIIIVAVLLVSQVFMPKLQRDNMYGNAQLLYDQGNYDEAAQLFIELGNYKNSDAMQQECLTKQREQIRLNLSNSICQAGIDGIIQFGHYNQDDDSTNGDEPIEWLVLKIDKDNNTAFLVSAKGLECLPYSNAYKVVPYPDSTIREWLENAFATQAFTEAEDRAIVEQPRLLTKDEFCSLYPDDRLSLDLTQHAANSDSNQNREAIARFKMTRVMQSIDEGKTSRNPDELLRETKDFESAIWLQSDGSNWNMCGYLSTDRVNASSKVVYDNSDPLPIYPAITVTLDNTHE